MMVKRISRRTVGRKIMRIKTGKSTMLQRLLDWTKKIAVSLAELSKAKVVIGGRILDIQISLISLEK